MNKILYDARHLSKRYTGLARYSYCLLKELIYQKRFQSLVIILEEGHSNEFYEDIIKLGTTCKNISFLKVPISPFSVFQSIKLPLYISNFKDHEYFYPHFNVPAFSPSNTTFVVHDLLPLLVDGYILKYSFVKKLVFKAWIMYGLTVRRFKCVAISQTTKNDIRKFISRKGMVVTATEGAFLKISNNKVSRSFLLPSASYLLYVGDRRPHKNLEKGIELFLEIKKKGYQGDFIVAGARECYGVDLEKKYSKEASVKFIGKVSDSELIKLYQNMDALFFPSLYEGFGLPVVEAASFGKKIIVNNGGSLKEISPPWALKIDVSDKENASSSVKSYLDINIDIFPGRYLQTYSWERAVEQLWGAE